MEKTVRHMSILQCSNCIIF